MDYNENKLIRDLAEDDRPREKAIRMGIESLTDAELMAIIFSTGIKGKSVVQLCNEILESKGGHLSKVTKMTVKDMCDTYKGIGKVKAITLLAALQLGARAAKDALVADDVKVVSSEIAYNLMRHHFERIQHEEFWILLIDRAGHVIRDVRISQGGIAATTVDLKLILKSAIESLASSMILYHNHPSGTLKPSVEDDRLTRRIVDGAKMVDVRVHYHIIIT
ncbi:MAG: DNA repair protein RadC [Muribaculaceae bacterium]|nr:DNA repair protein RadC [Muribaculaceae bacterium]